MEACPPDPCDIKSADLEGIQAAVNDLCALLNPNTTLPPLPINALLKSTGTNDFVADSTYDSNKLIAESNTSYTLPNPPTLPPGQAEGSMISIPKPPSIIETYYNQYVVKFGGLIEKIIEITKSKNTESGVLVSLEESSLVQYSKIKDKKLFDLPWPISDVYSYKANYKNIVETILADPNLKLDSFEDAANKYWIESDVASLKFIDSKLNIQIPQYNDQKLKKAYSDLSYGYVENSFPYTIIDQMGGGRQANLDQSGIYDFSSYQKDWRSKDAEQIMILGTGIVYTRYTKPILNKKLEQMQMMKKDKNIEDVQEDMLEFTKIKKTFFG